jgi:hypothetical protein
MCLYVRSRDRCQFSNISQLYSRQIVAEKYTQVCVSQQFFRCLSVFVTYHHINFKSQIAVIYQTYLFCAVVVIVRFIKYYSLRAAAYSKYVSKHNLTTH